MPMLPNNKTIASDAGGPRDLAWAGYSAAELSIYVALKAGA